MPRYWILAAYALCCLGCARHSAPAPASKAPVAAAGAARSTPTGPSVLPLQRKFSLKCPSIGYVSGQRPYIFIVCDPYGASLAASTPLGPVGIDCFEVKPPNDMPVMRHYMRINLKSPADIPVMLVLRLDTGLGETRTLDIMNVPRVSWVAVNTVASDSRFGKAWLPGGDTQFEWSWGA